MQQIFIKRIIATALACTVLFGAVAHAWAEVPASAPQHSAARAAGDGGEVGKPGDAVAAARRVSGLGDAANIARLGAERGKADLGKSEAHLSGVVSGNSATNVTTGSNSIDTGSFANMSGLPVVIQNTGANVLIQNATVINVLFK